MMDSHKEVWSRVSQELFNAQGGSGTAPLQPLQKPLAELGLDSLKLVEIVYELETFYQLDVDEERLAELGKIEDLIDIFITALADKKYDIAQGERHELAAE